MQVIASQGRPQRVLIVEQGHKLASAAQQWAQSDDHCAYAVEQVACGRAALDRIKSEFFDILVVHEDAICDLGAKDTASSLIRLARKAHKSLIVVMCEKVTVSGAVSAMGAGAHDLIAVPSSAAHLFDRIDHLRERHRKPQGGRLQCTLSVFKR